MASIHILTGAGKGDYHFIQDGTVVVGRGEDCDVQLRDEMISRHHMQIRFDDDASTYFVKDLESANGVFINGVRIAEEIDLVHNDTILIGETRMVFSIHSENDIGTVAD